LSQWNRKGNFGGLNCTIYSGVCTINFVFLHDSNLRKAEVLHSSPFTEVENNHASAQLLSPVGTLTLELKVCGRKCRLLVPQRSSQQISQ